MRKANANIKGLIRVSELARAASVSLPTIHYYIREGLLSPSIKTARNMSYYDPQCIEEIRLIKELQSKRYLPLSVIKLILRARREGQSMDHVAEMESLLGDIFQPVADKKESGMSLSELVSASGLSESNIEALKAKSLIKAIETGHGLIYDDIDIRIAQIFKRLAELRVKSPDLDIYRQYMEIIRIEFKTIHETIHQLPDHEIISLQELFKIVDDLKRYLAMRVYREEAQHSHEHSSLQKEDS